MHGFVGCTGRHAILSRVLADGALEQVESYCYLGVLMSSRLT